jgi:tetratricopeptide (TPR) repeat protein
MVSLLKIIINKIKSDPFIEIAAIFSIIVGIIAISQSIWPLFDFPRNPTNISQGYDFSLRTGERFQFQEGNYEAAIRSYDKIPKDDPLYIKACYRKGWALNDSRKYDEAIQAFNTVIEIDQNYSLDWYGKAWHGKGVALYYLGKYAEANQACDKAIEIDQDYSPAWFCKGWALYGLGKFNESLQAFNQSIDTEPNFDAWRGKGLALKALGRTTEADAALTKAKELGYKG